MTDTTTTQAPEPITWGRLEELLSEAVRQRGASYTYRPPPGKSDRDPRCLYVHDRGTPAQQPGCIIGLVYQLHTGQPVPPHHEGKSAGELDVWADSEVAEAAGRVQMDQDAGMAWGEAVALGLDPDLAEEDEDGDHYEDSDAYEGAF
jgi:hypothetical protein